MLGEGKPRCGVSGEASDSQSPESTALKQPFNKAWGGKGRTGSREAGTLLAFHEWDTFREGGRRQACLRVSRDQLYSTSLCFNSSPLGVSALFL